MSTVPKKPFDRLQFYESHLAPFAANAVAIGTSAAAVTDLTTKTTNARAAWEDKLAAEQASKVATSAWNNAVEIMGLAGAAIIDQIRAKAKLTPGSTVWDLAQIPAPATPQPVGPPGQPTDLVVKLTQTGALDMSWKCPNPVGASGTTYNVFRRIGDVGEYTYVGGTGVRQFTDESAPGGSPSIMYKIQAVRSTAVGPWATFNVFLGVSSTGATTIARVVDTTPKMAA